MCDSSLGTEQPTAHFPVLNISSFVSAGTCRKKVKQNQKLGRTNNTGHRPDVIRVAAIPMQENRIPHISYQINTVKTIIRYTVRNI